ncbi:MAG: M23 family metallopeptidase [Desulfobacterales bacterium]
MEGMNRRKFLKRTGKLTLAGTAALNIGTVISQLVPNPLKLAFASEAKVEFDVYNDVNPNTKDIVAHTFKDCLAKKWLPGICYKTSNPMVAVASGTVTEIIALEEYTKSQVHASAFKRTLMDEENNAKGFFVRVNHGNNESIYLHLKKPELKFGQKIKRGQIIGHPDERWNMPRLVFIDYHDQSDPNNYGMNHSFMNYGDGSTDLEIGKAEQRKRVEKQILILNNIAGMVEGPEKYTLLRKKHKGRFPCKWSPIEKFRYIEYLHQNKPATFPSLTKERLGEIKKEFYSNQPIILTLPFMRG